MLPTFDNFDDDNPDLDTSGKTETLIDDAEAPDQGPEKKVGKVAAPAADPFIPQVSAEYFRLPGGEVVPEKLTERRIGSIDPDGVSNSVNEIPDQEAFMREAEAHLALGQGEKQSNAPDWIKKPAVWPDFITFPSRRDLEAIRIAEEKGKLDDERKAKFNEHFEHLSVLMQARARQMDKWIMSENDEIIQAERNRFFLLKSNMKSSILELKRMREADEEMRTEAMNNGEDVSEMTSDPFHDIKWAVLLDPYASPDDPRFAEVARWGHGLAVMHDGGNLRADDNGFTVPFGDDGSVMAGKMAVLEAIERGWTSIDIAGSEEFVKGARDAALQAGLGAKITTLYGFAAKSKTEFIMPKPPKLGGVDTPPEQAKDAHGDLISGVGQAPKGKQGPIIDGSNSSDTSGGKPTAPGGSDDLIDVPFAEDEADTAAMNAIRTSEDASLDMT